MSVIISQIICNLNIFQEIQVNNKWNMKALYCWLYLMGICWWLVDSPCKGPRLWKTSMPLWYYLMQSLKSVSTSFFPNEHICIRQLFNFMLGQSNSMPSWCAKISMLLYPFSVLIWSCFSDYHSIHKCHHDKFSPKYLQKTPQKSVISERFGMSLMILICLICVLHLL